MPIVFDDGAAVIILKALKSSILSFILSTTLVNAPSQCLINYIIDTPKILVLEKLWQ